MKKYFLVFFICLTFSAYSQDGYKIIYVKDKDRPNLPPVAVVVRDTPPQTAGNQKIQKTEKNSKAFFSGMEAGLGFITDLLQNHNNGNDQEDQEYEYICQQGCTDNCEAAKKKLSRKLGLENMFNMMKRDGANLWIGMQRGISWITEYAFKGKTKGGLFDMRYGYNKAGKKAARIIKDTEFAIDIMKNNEPAIILGVMGKVGIPFAHDVSEGIALLEETAEAYKEVKEYRQEWAAYCEEQWNNFYKQHKKMKREKK